MKNNNGFTLIEILIAITVFAILATLTSSILYHVFNTRKVVDRQSKRLVEAQLAITLLQRDTRQIIDRSIPGYGSQNSFKGKSHYLEFTRGGNKQPEEDTLRNTLTRVAYLCQNEQLIRRVWGTGANDQLFEDHVLLKNLNQCQFAYLTYNHDVINQWEKRSANPIVRRDILPSAIQYTFNLKDWGNISLLFIIPEALYAN